MTATDTFATDTASPTVMLQSARETDGLVAGGFTRARGLPALRERLAARIGNATDELLVVASAEIALDAIVANFVAGRRTTLARPVADDLAAQARAAALVWREAAKEPSTPCPAAPEKRRRPYSALDPLIEAARDAETLVVSNPAGLDASALAPRELLELRARAPRPLIVLDLRDEDSARSTLTQPALLLPGTILVRAFGSAWREAGARALAGLAFIAGPREILEACPAESKIPAARLDAACRELDDPEIERTAYRIALGAACARR